MSVPTEVPGGAGAATDPRSRDPELQGRTYAIPFERVWTGALQLAAGGLPRWRVLKADDQRGVILAVSTSTIRKHASDVRITVGLDADGQTRVDLSAEARDGRGRLRHDRKSITTFLRHLDRVIEAREGLILAPRAELQGAPGSLA
ncbi:MAG: hypothetical protein P8170_05120 [Gemmatimonadota bacterium]